MDFYSTQCDVYTLEEDESNTSKCAHWVEFHEFPVLSKEHPHLQDFALSVIEGMITKSNILTDDAHKMP